MAERTGKTGPFLEFGKWLVKKRLEANLASQPQAELRARQKHLRLINQGKLTHIERGLNGNPDPEFLAELATLYGIPYEELITEWTRVRYAVRVTSQKVSPGAQVSDTKGHSQTNADGSKDSQSLDVNGTKTAELSRRGSQGASVFAGLTAAQREPLADALLSLVVEVLEPGSVPGFTGLDRKVLQARARKAMGGRGRS